MSSSRGVGSEPDPLEGYYRVEEIERLRWEDQKRNRGGGPPNEPPDDNRGFAAFVLLFVEKALDYIKQSIRKGGGAATQEPARENLSLIKAAFETMMREDRSQDAQFLKQLSTLWQETLSHSIELVQMPWTKQLKRLIKDIESYPENEEHTFGYYLDEYAGQKWLPFPYMELIQTLHHQHELDPSSSLLTRWTRMIEEILNRD